MIMGDFFILVGESPLTHHERTKKEQRNDNEARMNKEMILNSPLFL